MPLQFKHTTLPNGLTVIAEINPDAHTSAVGFFVMTGARDEDPTLMGVSHFLEHMMFKGTSRRTADDVNREFDDMGASYNAFTSHEQTVFYAQVLPEFTPRAVDLLGDILRPALREGDFSMEKNVILEEIGMYDDRPEWRLQDAMLEDYFGAHPLAHRVLGTTDTVTKLTAEQMRGYFATRYSPDNIVLAAAGRVDWDALVADVERVTQEWSPTGTRRAHGSPEAREGQRAMADDKLSRHYTGVLCPGPSAQDEMRYPAKILSDVLGDSDGSRLYWALIDPGLADDADFSYMPQDQTGCFLAYATCSPERATQVEETLLATVDAVATDSSLLEEDEVVRAKNKLATQATLQGERPMGRMQAIGSSWAYLGRYLPLEEELAKLMAVTRDDLAELLRQYPLRPRTVLRLGPGEGKRERAAA